MERPTAPKPPVSDADSDDEPIAVKRQKPPASPPLPKRPVESDADSDDEPIVQKGGAEKSAEKKSGGKVKKEIEKKGGKKAEGKKGTAKKNVKKEPEKKQPKRKAQPKPKARSPRAAKEEPEDFERGDARKFFKSGQRYICPPNGDGTRMFYETFLLENPDSPMAIKYCIEFGCLVGSAHKEALETYNRLKEGGLFKGKMGGLKTKEVAKVLKRR